MHFECCVSPLPSLLALLLYRRGGRFQSRHFARSDQNQNHRENWY